MKRILVLVLALCAILTCTMGLASCGNNKSDVAKIKESGFINVGITVYEPMDYQNDDEEWIGFDADLANAFAEKLGVRARFTVIKWDAKVMELKGGMIDVIWNGMTASDTLEEEIDLTIPYATNCQCVVVKKDQVASITKADDVKALTVAVESGSAGDTVVTDTLKMPPNRVKDQVSALMEVKAGSSQAAVVDYTLAYNVVGKGDLTDLAIVPIETVAFEQEVFAIGAREGSDLVAELNAFLKDQYKAGKMTELATKYNVALNEDTLK